eukprot:g4385.t1
MASRHQPGAYQPTNEPTNRRSDGAQEQQRGYIDKQAAEKRSGGKDDRADDPPSDDGSGVDLMDEIAEKVLNGYYEGLLSDFSMAAGDSDFSLDKLWLYHDDYMRKLLCCEKACAFLKGKAVKGRRFCVLDAKTENIIGVTPEWLEAAGLAVEDVMKANGRKWPHIGEGLRRAVADLSAPRQPRPPELSKFLEKPDDIFVPQKVTRSSSNGYGQGSGPVLFQNLLAGTLPKDSRARVAKFSLQWHKKDGRTYTGYTAVSRLFCHNEDGTDENLAEKDKLIL